MKKKLWLLVAVCAFVAAGVFGWMGWQRYQEKKTAQELYQAMQRQEEEYAKMRQEKEISPDGDAGGKATDTEAAARETEAPLEAAVEESKTTPAAGETTVSQEEADQVPEAASAVDEKEENKEGNKEKLVIPVNFQKLQEENPDIYAWITIPGTEIDYPIVQREGDNTFYLNHTADKEESINGAIFSEDYNQKDFDDYITVLYGHNMKDGSMFAGLHEYEDNLYMKEHSIINVYTPDAILKYRIFAAYRGDDKHLLLSFNQGVEEENRRDYLEEIMGHRTMESQIEKDALVDTDSKILTLSTCDKAGDVYRYLVQAYLVEKFE